MKGASSTPRRSINSAGTSNDGENVKASQQQAPASSMTRFLTFLKHFKASGWCGFGDNTPSIKPKKGPSYEHARTTSKEDLANFEKAAATLLNRSRGQSLLFQETNVFTRIKLCQQLETWDCGIACIQMVLRWLRQDTMEYSRDTRKLTTAEVAERDWMLRTIGTESVWTIDLVLLLEKLIHLNTAESFTSSTVSYLFCSTNMGVDTSYHGLGYYHHAFQRDEVRVKQLFEEAQTMGLPSLCVRHLGLTEVVNMVSNENCVAIVLLDNFVLLRNKTVDSNRATHGQKRNSDNLGATNNLERRDEQQSSCETDCNVQHSDTYAGHYVVLCGISFNPVDVANAEKNQGHKSDSDYCMVIKNPANCSEVNFVTPDHFERSWRSTGTDEDIIFIAKHHDA